LLHSFLEEKFVSLGFLTNLTAVVLLAHTLLGCCGHHGHDDEHASDKCQETKCVFIRPASENVADASHSTLPTDGLPALLNVPDAMNSDRGQLLDATGPELSPARLQLSHQVLLI
jgi:hypothetical protein